MGDVTSVTTLLYLFVLVFGAKNSLRGRLIGEFAVQKQISVLHCSKIQTITERHLWLKFFYSKHQTFFYLSLVLRFLILGPEVPQKNSSLKYVLFLTDSILVLHCFFYGQSEVLLRSRALLRSW